MVEQNTKTRTLKKKKKRIFSYTFEIFMQTSILILIKFSPIIILTVQQYHKF